MSTNPIGSGLEVRNLTLKRPSGKCHIIYWTLKVILFSTQVVWI